MSSFFEQLTKFVQQTGVNQTLAILTAAAAVCVALTAIIAPVVAVYVAKRQIRATVVSVNRQKWIDTLRDLISELISVHIVAFHTRNLSDPDISRNVFKLQNKILLLTNLIEADHIELNRVIERIVNSGPNDPGIDIEQLRTELVEISRRILKTEWTRVRRGQ